MPNAFGLTLWGIGVLSIIVALYILNIIVVRYLKKNQFKKYFNLAIIFMIAFVIFRIFLFFRTVLDCQVSYRIQLLLHF